MLFVSLIIKSRRVCILDTQIEELIARWSLLMIGVSLVELVFALKDYLDVQNTNADLKKLPYGFDYEKELFTYKMIGQDKKNSKNILQKFEKYSEWKAYLQKEYLKHKNCEDFYRFLVRRLREKRNTKDLLIMVLIPTEIAAFSVYYGMNKDMDEITVIISLTIVVCFLVIILSKNYTNAMIEIEFLEDYIEILFGKE